MEIKTGDKVRLSEDVVSYAKRGRIYARRIEIVEVTAIHDKVLIVEDKKAFRFSVHINNIQSLK